MPKNTDPVFKRMNLMTNRITKRSEQLTDIFHQIKQLNDDELADLYELVSLHNEALFIVGDLTSEAVQVRDTAYAERKRIFAEILLGETGTVAVKEATAELAVKEHRQNEAKYNAMYQKYKLMFQSLDHRLIDYRQKRNKLEHELQTINDKQG